MTAVVVAGGTLTRALNDDQMGRISIELSADGSEIGVGSMVLDDPAGNDDIAGGRQVKVSEGIATLTDGFIGAKDTSRGATRNAPNREDLYQIQDANRLLYGKRFVNRSRPAETDRSRVLAFAAADLSGVDTTWVLATNLVTLPKKKYTGQDWSELMTDVLESAGKLIFIHDKTDGSGRCLHSHKETEGHTCGLTISDDPSTEGDAYAFSPANANRNRSAGELENNVLGRDQSNRTSTDTDATSISLHDADGALHQSIVEFETSSRAELNSKTTNRMLEHRSEIGIFECDIGPLDQNDLRRIRQGDQITVTSAVMGLSGSAVRIALMTLTIARDANGKPVPGYWIAHLNLDRMHRFANRVPSGAKHVTRNDMLRALQPFCVPGPQKETFTRSGTGLGTSEFDGGPAWDGIHTGASSTTDGDEAVLVSTSGLGSPSVWAINLPFTSIMPLEVLFECSLETTGVEAQAYIWFGTQLSEVTDSISSLSAIITLAAGNLDTVVTAGQTSGGGVTMTDEQVGVSEAQTFWIRILVDELGLSVSVSSIAAPDPTYDHFTPWDPGLLPGIPTLLEIGSAGTSEPAATTFRVKTITILQGLPEVCADPGDSVPLYMQEVDEIVGTGDGSTTAYATTSPYVIGTLVVTVDDLTERNVAGTPETGALLFSDPPFDTEVVRARYRVAL